MEFFGTITDCIDRKIDTMIEPEKAMFEFFLQTINPEELTSSLEKILAIELTVK